MAWLTEAGRRWWVYLGLAALPVGIYFTAAGLQGKQGFPLDDAWIHQTYARNLVSSGRWEYLPGEVSAGSTSPLWTALLAAGYLVGLSPFWWTWGLGTLSLALCGLLAHRLAEQLFPKSASGWAAPASGLLCVGEWHMVWAAVSGMETLLFTALSLLFMERVARCAGRDDQSRGRWEWAGVGLAAALLVLTRPEGVVLVGLGALAVAAKVSSPRKWARAGVVAALPFAALVVPYLILNYSASGRLWPNTFYAKQAEYSALLTEPLTNRLARVLLPPLTGFQLLLVPGMVAAAISGIRQLTRYRSDRRWIIQVLPLMFAVSQMGLYAWRLPVIYQHGRYLMPVIPSLVLCGVMGTAEWIRLGGRQKINWVLSRSASGAVAVLLVAFVVIGAGAYARDVRVIEGEMVAVARWVAENTAPEELVAAHDIGAIGYFSQRPILDLAGLISPEVVPFLGDEAAVADYVLESSARYLVSAPGWDYSEITDRPDVEMLFDADLKLTQDEGMSSSAVYRLP